MIASEIRRLTRTERKLLMWWIEGRTLENDESRTISTATADRVVLLEQTHGLPGDTIADWWTSEECRIWQPTHPLGHALKRLLETIGIGWREPTEAERAETGTNVA